MRIGIPAERKVHEYRVALTPAGAHRLAASGHEVLVQSGAGTGSAISDDDYRAAGARIVATAEEVWAADLVCKVKEPVAAEYPLLRRGLLLGGVPGVEPARVVILGGGVAGRHAAEIAVGMRADVTILDLSLPRLRELDAAFGGRVRTVASSPYAIEQAVLGADLVIGAALVPGAKAPTLVSNDLVSRMRPGSVLVDIAVDQGGCFADTHATTHAEPTYPVHGSVFYCVANMPGAVPVTSTGALTNATLPYLVRLADRGWRAALMADPALAAGLTTHEGALLSGAVAEAHGYVVADPSGLLVG